MTIHGLANLLEDLELVPRTPPQIISKLYAGMVKALAMPDVKEAILKQGSKAVSSKSPEEFARYIKSEAEKFYPVIQAAGLEGSQ